LIFDSIDQLICSEHKGSMFIHFNLNNSVANYFCEECLKTDKEITAYYYKCKSCDGFILGMPIPAGKVELFIAKNGLYEKCFDKKREDFIARIPHYQEIPECVICKEAIGFWMPMPGRCTKYDPPYVYR